MFKIKFPLILVGKMWRVARKVQRSILYYISTEILGSCAWFLREFLATKLSLYVFFCLLMKSSRARTGRVRLGLYALRISTFNKEMASFPINLTKSKTRRYLIAPPISIGTTRLKCRFNASFANLKVTCLNWIQDKDSCKLVSQSFVPLKICPLGQSTSKCLPRYYFPRKR